MKKTIENKTEVKKGSTLYNVWNTDVVHVYEVTSVKVLNERAIDVTMLLRGSYGHIRNTLDDNKYTCAIRVSYEHIIIENGNTPRFLNSFGFVDGVTWHLSREDCEKQVERNFYKNKYMKLIDSVKTIYNFLNERKQ